MPLFLYIKLLLYLFKHYTLTIKSLNLLNNPIDHNIINEIHKYVKNDYDLDPTSRDTLAADHQKSVNKIKAIEKKLKKQSNKVRHADTSSNADLNALNVNSANLNVNSELDLRLRDQLKLEEYISNANRFNGLREDMVKHSNEKIEYQRELDRLEYQRALERDYNASKTRYELWRENNKFINEKLNPVKDSAEDKYETSELLQPFDDLRFKTHSILPFNLVRY